MHRDRMTDIFFFNDTATTEIYTLSLHDALPISPDLPAERPLNERARRPGDARLQQQHRERRGRGGGVAGGETRHAAARPSDRKSTPLNSSHANISYVVFCLKKKQI